MDSKQRSNPAATVDVKTADSTSGSAATAAAPATDTAKQKSLSASSALSSVFSTLKGLTQPAPKVETLADAVMVTSGATDAKNIEVRLEAAYKVNPDLNANAAFASACEHNLHAAFWMLRKSNDPRHTGKPLDVNQVDAKGTYPLVHLLPSDNEAKESAALREVVFTTLFRYELDDAALRKAESFMFRQNNAWAEKLREKQKDKVRGAVALFRSATNDNIEEIFTLAQPFKNNAAFKKQPLAKAKTTYFSPINGVMHSFAEGRLNYETAFNAIIRLLSEFEVKSFCADILPIFKKRTIEGMQLWQDAIGTCLVADGLQFPVREHYRHKQAGNDRYTDNTLQLSILMVILLNQEITKEFIDTAHRIFKTDLNSVYSYTYKTPYSTAYMYDFITFPNMDRDWTQSFNALDIAIYTGKIDSVKTLLKQKATPTHHNLHPSLINFLLEKYGNMASATINPKNIERGKNLVDAYKYLGKNDVQSLIHALQKLKDHPEDLAFLKECFPNNASLATALKATLSAEQQSSLAAPTADATSAKSLPAVGAFALTDDQKTLQKLAEVAKTLDNKALGSELETFFTGQSQKLATLKK